MVHCAVLLHELDAFKQLSKLLLLQNASVLFDGILVGCIRPTTREGPVSHYDSESRLRSSDGPGRNV